MRRTRPACTSSSTPRASCCTSARRRVSQAPFRQHAGAKPGAGGDRLDVLYRQVGEVRWHVLADEDAAAAWEADVIVALRPVFNAAHRSGPLELRRRRTARTRRRRREIHAVGGRSEGAFVRVFFHTSVAASARGPRSRAATATPRCCACSGPDLMRSTRTSRAGSPARRPTASKPRFPAPCVHRSTPSSPAPATVSSAQSPESMTRVRATSRPALAIARLRNRSFVHGPRALRRLRLRHGRPPALLAPRRIGGRRRRRPQSDRRVPAPVAPRPDRRLPRPTRSPVGKERDGERRQ